MEEIRCRAEEISKASDRVNFENLSQTTFNTADPVSVRHLISGQHRTVKNLPQLSDSIIDRLNAVAGNDARKAFWWLWRFYPQYLTQQQPDALLYPADRLIPDCPLHSYNSTVSAIAGAIPQDYVEEDADKHPYLLLFTFSPVQEFIKSSRKFLDFWAGSYLLHYLSARLCWYIARVYGPDAVITPSLWSQEIIDALIAKQYPNFQTDFAHFQGGSNPASRFQDRTSTSLSTAGFPNVITAIVPGKVAAEKLGAKLGQHLNKQWRKIALKVRSDIRHSVIDYLNDESKQDKIEELIVELAISEGILDSPDNPNRHELEQWKKESSWEWRKLWEAQIDCTWEPYWTAVPLGHPERTFSITGQENVPSGDRDRIWIQDQETIAPSRNDQPTPTEAEDFAYTELNIGTWWANSQSRLGQAIQAVKNTRNWRIPAAPGERSTISGQFSAVHPQLRYGTHQPRRESAVRDLREGAGMSSGSMQLFWQLMALVYPGLFNGSEKLNALELTKRMAWQYGGVAKSLGIKIEKLKITFELDEEDTEAMGYQTITTSTDINYDRLIRFPNLSSIASARFVRDNLSLARRYWREIAKLIQTKLPKDTDKFGSKTRGKAFNIPQVDRFINPNNRDGQDYNGVMFSSKWLAEDMGLEKEHLTTLRGLVKEAHKKCGFGDSSPADWWTIIVADGDGMGKYVNGSKLKPYQEYLNLDVLNSQPAAKFNELLETRKRMGPATHVGLNRALLDFSNRIVPYLTEQRFCGKVVYSGGDDVLAVLPLADLPEYLLSLRAAWCGGQDPYTEKDPKISFTATGGYWEPNPKNDTQNSNFCGLQNRPLFTMGEGATMSAGIVIAHKSVPLPTVLESLWSAEKDCAKEMQGATISHNEKIEPKDGLCFRVIYGGGNVLEATMKGHLLSQWWEFVSSEEPNNLAPVLYRLAEELPTHAALTESDRLLTKAAKVIINSRDESLPQPVQDALCDWLNNWEDWAYRVDMNWQQLRKQKPEEPQPVGCSIQDLAKLLRFSAFWLDKMAQQNSWGQVR
ncbi:type III-B CRISPR-associated protein Cas10/Cmr2 [Microcoleus sp. herbarium12]|uniref:type III-B CRISPR-associated protein Cas10/Cmr2 n=1 Tax=Microcoleus sp. herbarium12 TaxID=3055437 RepID=UPI002FD58761